MLDLEYKKAKPLLSYKVIITAGIIGVAAVFMVFLPLLILNKRVNIQDYSTYEIRSGATPYEVAEDLARKNIIANPLLFHLYLKIKRLDRNLQAGRFTFPSREMSLKDLVEFLTNGEQAPEVKFTVPEGYTAIQIAELLSQLGLVEKEKFLA